MVILRKLYSYLVVKLPSTSIFCRNNTQNATDGLNRETKKLERTKKNKKNDCNFYLSMPKARQLNQGHKRLFDYQFPQH